MPHFNGNSHDLEESEAFDPLHYRRLTIIKYAVAFSYTAYVAEGIFISYHRASTLSLRAVALPRRHAG